MPTFRIKEAAGLLGVSDDTLRRWADGGRVETTTDAAGRLAVDGVALARLAGCARGRHRQVHQRLRRDPQGRLISPASSFERLRDQGWTSQRDRATELPAAEQEA
jgi:excisionase family DNA binding protein